MNYHFLRDAEMPSEFSNVTRTALAIQINKHLNSTLANLVIAISVTETSLSIVAPLT
ncbi:hypothetical protein H2248_005487 [Termitomyces sp. 'cryptogamus']|nr:hypothetical protein H2248_005487 [Termitomyces sp. 'cryptogamus']